MLHVHRVDIQHICIIAFKIILQPLGRGIFFGKIQARGVYFLRQHTILQHCHIPRRRPFRILIVQHGRKPCTETGHQVTP